MQKKLVSIVLPIYNVEQYLDRCLSSVVNQTYKNLEILLIDDGSPDKCPEICEEWKGRDNRIKVIHKENAGLGMARNTGIENASGEYIYFVDSDDYIALDTIEKCINSAKKEDADIVTFGHYNINAEGDIVNTTIPNTPKNKYEGKEIQDYFLPNMIAPDTISGICTNLKMSACLHFCKLEMIKQAKWKFASERNIISEDVYSILELYYYVKRVVVLPEAFYFYCENSLSLSHTYRQDRSEKNYIFYKACLEKCEQLRYSEIIKNRLAYAYLSNMIATLKMVYKANLTVYEKKQYMRKIIRDKHLQTILKHTCLKNEKRARKILLICIQKKMVNIVFFLIKIKA